MPASKPSYSTSADRSWPPTSALAASTSSTRCPATTTASSTSASCASATGRATTPVSSDVQPPRRALASRRSFRASSGLAAGALAAVGLVPRAFRRMDERRPAGTPAGLGDTVPGTEVSQLTSDDGAELHVVERGRGDPLLLVHGLSLDHRTWH